jgi:hypothetical protein
MFHIIKVALGVYFGKLLFNNRKKILILCTLLATQAKQMTDNPSLYIAKAKDKTIQLSSYTFKTTCSYWNKYPNALPVKPQTICRSK